MTERTGWFADIDPEYRDEGWAWQPCLQLGGACHSFQVWHATEADCLEFIRTEIIGRGLIDDASEPQG